MELTNSHQIIYAGLQPKPDKKYGKYGQELICLAIQSICFTALIFAELTFITSFWTSSVPNYFQNVQEYRRCHLYP